MKKDTIIEILQCQLKVSHETTEQLRASIVILNNTIEDLRKTILTLEEKLQERNSKQRSDS